MPSGIYNKNPEIESERRERTKELKYLKKRSIRKMRTTPLDDWVAIGEQSFCEFMISVGWLVESSWFTRFLVEALMVSRNERDYGLENQLVMMDWGFDTL